jgi:hypothetical protein
VTVTPTTSMNGANTPEPQGLTGGSPSGARIHRERWRDPRLLVGMALVVASLLGVLALVNVSDDTVSVWAVRGDIVAGAEVTESQLRPVSVHLPELDPYVKTGDVIAPGLVATHDFASGELLTKAGVAPADEAGRQRIVTLPVLRNQMPADLRVGDRVDVYVVERGVDGEPSAAPRLVLRSAIVTGVDDDSGAFGGSSLDVGVALSVDSSQVADVVAAQAHGTVTLVDVPVGNG